jgi:hypothetical protein
MSRDDKIRRILRSNPEPKEDRAKGLDLRTLQGAGGVPKPIPTPEDLCYSREISEIIKRDLQTGPIAKISQR